MSPNYRPWNRNFEIGRLLLRCSWTARKSLWVTNFQKFGGPSLRKDSLFGINRLYERKNRQYLYQFVCLRLKLDFGWVRTD